MTSGLNLLLGGASMASVVVVQSAWVTAAAAGTYVVALGVTMCRKPFWWRTLKEVRCRPPELPHPSALCDQQLRDLLARLHEARRERRWRLRSIGRSSLDRVEPLFEPIVDLEASAVKILMTADCLARALAEGPGTRIFARTKLLATRAEESGDEFVRLELRRASEAAGQHAVIVSQLAEQQRKLIARLEWIAEALDLASGRLLEAELDPKIAELVSCNDSFDDMNTDDSIKILLGAHR
jgi:hypothetical protein